MTDSRECPGFEIERIACAEVEAFSNGGGKGESGIRSYRNKLVTTRKKHTCFSLIGRQHPLPKGSRAVTETYIVRDSGGWGSSYVCIKCVREYLEDIYSDHNDCLLRNQRYKEEQTND